jgi:hypothetical protein
MTQLLNDDLEGKSVRIHEGKIAAPSRTVDSWEATSEVSFDPNRARSSYSIVPRPSAIRLTRVVSALSLFAGAARISEAQ